MQGRTIVHQAGDMLRDLPCVLGLQDVTNDQQLLLMFNNHIDIVHMQKTAAKHPRHSRVHLGDDEIGGPRRRGGDIHGNAEAHPTEVVRRRHLHQGDMDGDLATAEQVRNRREIDRSMKSAVPRKVLGDRRTGIERSYREAFRRLFIGDHGDGRSFEAQQPNDFKIGEITELCRKLLHQVLRLSAR